MLEPAHCFPHQLWRAAQIPLRIGDVDMAEVGGQDRQATFWVLIVAAGAIVPEFSRIGIVEGYRAARVVRAINRSMN